MWEMIDSGTHRMRVPNGWIVRSWLLHSVHMVFVPDSGHIWVLEK
jgi:hypothetical protein